MAAPTSVPTGLLTVEVTAPYPAHGGLIDVLESLGFVKDVADPHMGLGVNYDKPFCVKPHFAPGLCDDALNIPVDTEKEFEEPDSGEALAFAIYSGIICSPFYKGFDKALENLEAGASYAVEQAFQILYLDDAPAQAGGPFSVAEAIAVAEQALADNTNGGFIVTSRYGAAWLANTRGIKSDENYHLYTAQGTPIINGGGIARVADGGTPTGSQFTIYVVAPFTLLRGPVLDNSGQGLSTNTELSLAEQLYSITGPCYMLAITVDPEA